MITFRKYIIIKIKGFVHSNTHTFERGTIIENYEIAWVTEDSSDTGTTTKNCNISHMTFINIILLLLSVYLSGIQKLI